MGKHPTPNIERPTSNVGFLPDSGQWLDWCLDCLDCLDLVMNSPDFGSRETGAVDDSTKRKSCRCNALPAGPISVCRGEVATTSKSVVSRVSQLAGRAPGQIVCPNLAMPIWKPAIRQAGKPAQRVGITGTVQGPSLSLYFVRLVGLVFTLFTPPATKYSTRYLNATGILGERQKVNAS